jgi:MSHA pilin protein MshA
MSQSKQRGFTLIELVVVIVILGILAAFALPRFMNLEQKARIASLSGVEGGLRSGAALAHSVWLANGNSAATTVVVEGVTIDMVNGYPAATATGIGRVLAPGTVQGGNGRYAIAVTGTTANFNLTGAPLTGGATCQVSYLQSTAANVPPTINVSATMAAPAGC